MILLSEKIPTIVSRSFRLYSSDTPKIWWQFVWSESPRQLRRSGLSTSRTILLLLNRASTDIVITTLHQPDSVHLSILVPRTASRGLTTHKWYPGGTPVISSTQRPHHSRTSRLETLPQRYLQTIPLPPFGLGRRGGALSYRQWRRSHRLEEMKVWTWWCGVSTVKEDGWWEGCWD